MDCREDSESHFLEPQSSTASTISTERERRAGDTLNPRFDDDGSSSSDEEDGRHDQRADLQRMMSRRNFAVVESNGMRHRVRSSSGVESVSMGGEHRRRQPSVAPEVDDSPPGDQRQSNQVEGGENRGDAWVVTTEGRLI